MQHHHTLALAVGCQVSGHVARCCTCWCMLCCAAADSGRFFLHVDHLLCMFSRPPGVVLHGYGCCSCFRPDCGSTHVWGLCFITQPAARVALITIAVVAFVACVCFGAVCSGQNLSSEPGPRRTHCLPVVLLLGAPHRGSFGIGGVVLYSTHAGSAWLPGPQLLVRSPLVFA